MDQKDHAENKAYDDADHIQPRDEEQQICQYVGNGHHFPCGKQRRAVQAAGLRALQLQHALHNMVGDIEGDEGGEKPQDGCGIAEGGR